jgi:RluA family pseudouridine synthase
MSQDFKKVPKKFHPKGYELLYEDRDLLVGNKAAGYITVAAKWNQDNSLQQVLDRYVQKGDSRSRKCVYAVHRLDQATTGVLIFAKTESVQNFLKDNWPTTKKIYYAIAHGKFVQKTGLIESYLEEDEEYVVHANTEGKGKLARTEYEVLKEAGDFSLVKINLLTGRKNQIRVHLADLGHPLVGDPKYGAPDTKFKNLALHAYSIEFTHPFSKARVLVKAEVPPHFRKLVSFDY